jgi:chromosome segregation ATPase
MGVCGVSIKGPKTGTHEEEHRVAKEPTPPRTSRKEELTGVKREPVFHPNFRSDSTNPSHEIHIDSLPPEFGHQIDTLKSQVERISSEEKSKVLSPDQGELLKKYISLKEIENRDLKDQVHQFDGFVKKMSRQVETLEQRNRELVTDTETLRRREEALKEELKTLKDKQAEELALTRDEYEQRLRKSGNYEREMNALLEKREQWRERVKQDLNRIKLKERELENRYELLKRDMQALLDSKDKHVLDLKKRSDAQELELEGLEERLRKANLVVNGIDSKKRRLVETLRLALSLLESIDQQPAEDDSDPERKAG